MAKPLRVKTQWFKGSEDDRAPEETASAIAMLIWRLADGTVDSLSQAEYDIITPQRGFRIIAELCCFLSHYVDRQIYGRVDETLRHALVSAVGLRLAETMEDNVLDFSGGVKDPDYDHKAGFIDLMNRRNADYATFEFPVDKAGYQALRYLSLMIREVMEAQDQTWIQDQLMDIEVPQIMATVKKQIDGFFSPSA